MATANFVTTKNFPIVCIDDETFEEIYFDYDELCLATTRAHKLSLKKSTTLTRWITTIPATTLICVAARLSEPMMLKFAKSIVGLTSSAKKACGVNLASLAVSLTVLVSTRKFPEISKNT